MRFQRGRQGLRPAGRARRGGRGCRGCFGLVVVGGGIALLLLVLIVLSQNQPPPGPPQTAAPTPTPVPADQRLIFTYYFYWYDANTGGHLQEQSGLRHHLPAQPAPSWRNSEWHKKELADMAFAGIDVVLPVYWGFEKPEDEWSWKGLDVMAQAHRALRAEGRAAPQVGLFLDTTIVAGRDLTTAAGKEWFYANFRDFFTRVPREQWALVQGRPVAFLFTSD
ncbi:MAG TPA: hypothetical protein VHS99_16305, partial [Chloroflexota bacterium]|nr:hypothetical protein [Chloroflexota bacterium]